MFAACEVYLQPELKSNKTKKVKPIKNLFKICSVLSKYWWTLWVLIKRSNSELRLLDWDIHVTNNQLPKNKWYTHLSDTRICKKSCFTFLWSQFTDLDVSVSLGMYHIILIHGTVKRDSNLKITVQVQWRIQNLSCI